MNKTASCFSEENFDIVYQYLEDQMKKEEVKKYPFDTYVLNIADNGQGLEIRMKRDDYSLAIISKERGIYSLAKRLKDNNRLVHKANEIFCKILSLAEEKG